MYRDLLTCVPCCDKGGRICSLCLKKICFPAHVSTVGHSLALRMISRRKICIMGSARAASRPADPGLTSSMRFAIYLTHLIVIAGAAMLATLLSGLYPAWKAGHVAPVEAIRLV